MRKLYRSNTDSKIWGVCGGLAEYLGLDSTLIRIIWIIAFLCAGVGGFIYLVFAIIMPKRDDGFIDIDEDDNHQNYN